MQKSSLICESDSSKGIPASLSIPQSADWGLMLGEPPNSSPVRIPAELLQPVNGDHPEMVGNSRVSGNSGFRKKISTRDGLFINQAPEYIDQFKPYR